MELEYDNLRSTLAWCLETDPALGLRIVGAPHFTLDLCWYWVARGRPSEGRYWLRELLARAPERTFVLTNMPAELKPDELIVGICRMSMIGFGHTFPQYALPEEIEAAAKDNLSPLSVWGHQPPHYDKILAVGLSGIKAEIQAWTEREKGLDSPDPKRLELYRAMLIGLDGIHGLALRYHDMCLVAAQKETDPARKAELTEIAARCARVPSILPSPSRTRCSAPGSSTSRCRAAWRTSPRPHRPAPLPVLQSRCRARRDRRGVG